MTWHGGETVFDSKRFDAAYPGLRNGFRKPKNLTGRWTKMAAER